MKKKDIERIKDLVEYQSDKMNKHDANYYKQDLQSAINILEENKR